MKKILRLFVFIGFFTGTITFVSAQVTTSSLSGTVKDSKGEALEGATVKATHVPSGSVYHNFVQKGGSYFIAGMRPGGPYVLEISYIGYKTMQFKDVSLELGETYLINAELEADATLLGEVVVVGERTFDRNKTGAATNISNKNIQTLPTISRSINDFTRLTPQSNGLSFAGRDGRYNYITIDGAAFNNSFGLSGQTRNLPGGDAQPISLDAIDQISVNISPYDIRQSNFTGATINAVTKSGDNTLKGSAYTYLRPESFAGHKIEGQDYTWDKTSKQTFGVSLGGAIIKNKLFFFVNGEYEKSESPSTSWKAGTDGNADPNNYISRAKVSDLQTLKDYLKTTYDYDAGDWNWGKFNSSNYKILARADWNISNVHKLTVRYNQVVSTNDVLTNASSCPSGITRSNYSRISEKAIAFTNAGYGFENTVSSITGELNSTFGNKFSNKFLATYTMIRDKRTSPSSIFPFVDIWEGGDPYTSFGYELYTYNNDVKNNTFSITDNFSANFGDHTVTAGIAYEQQYFGNAYMSFATGYYRYNSLNAFLTNQKPDGYAITYGINGNTTPYSELSFGMGALYFQDELQLSPNVKITGGIRFELPFYLNDLAGNDAINAIEYQGGTSYLTYLPYKLDVSTWPKKQLLISPRLSANWDVLGDGKYKVRAGTGFFTGRLPFVWFTNQPTNDGTLQYLKVLSGTDVPADMRFDPAVDTQIKKYGTTLFPATTAAPAAPVEVAKDFKMPQVWRTNLAVDIVLPHDMTFTLEGIYTKDINAILQQNINEAIPNKTFEGSDNRPYYSPATNAVRRINPSLSNTMVLTNTNKGYQYSVTAMLTKKFSYGLSGMVAYTFSQAKDVTSNPGDQASSAWASNVVVGSLNDESLSWSNFSIPHRVIGTVTYEFDWLDRFHTTFSLLYQGSAEGRLSYVYSNDMNGDGNASSDLMYIPKDANDIVFKDLGAGMSPQEQSDAFFKFLEQDDYLKNHQGEYAERFGGLLPWRHRFDFKFVQDVFYDKKSGRKVQLTFDILNLGNLINSKWGVSKSQITGSYQNVPLLKYEGVEAGTGKPMFSLPVDVAKGKTAADYYTTSYKTYLGYGSTWSMLLGLRVTF
ncbi:MAG: carboxypeptidase regulatory-like domain-containing protein [Prevotellaceae bacterium]|nr:carboxypeptidase regulatory-like domain-containing protein [Prevotellaceae bacterium]